MKRFCLLIIIILGVLVVGCSDWKAKISSNTSWSGSFGGTTIDGSGDRTIDLPNDEIVCIVVQKRTRKGTLSAEIVNESFLGLGGSGKKTTTAEYGVVSVCSE